MFRFSLALLGLLVSASAVDAADLTNDLRLKQKKWGFSARYSGSTDLNETADENIYRHRISASSSYKLNKKWSINGTLTAQYSSVGTEIDVQENRRELFLQDTSIGISRSFKVSKKMFALTDLGVSLPTSKSSRLNGYNGIAWGSGTLINRFFKGKLTLSNGLNAYYVNNENYYREGGTFAVNTRAGLSYSLGLAYRLYKGLTLSGSTGPTVYNAVDDTNTVRFSNRLNLTYHMLPISVSLFYINGSYPDQADVEFWFLDEYRQIAGAGVSYVF